MKYLILSSSRSGSTYLASSIYAMLPDQALFLAEPFQTPILDSALFEKIKQCNNLVLKTHLNQLYKLPKEQIDYFLGNDFYIVFLLRKNLFACTFSAAVADAINNYNDKPYTAIEINIDPNKFLKLLDRKIEYWEKFAELKQKNIHKKIIYFENLSFNPITDASLILENFHFIKPNEITSPTPYNIIDVKNKDELQILFKERIKNYSHKHIINKDGIFKLANLKTILG